MGDLSENFNRAEFACKCGCGFDTVDAKLVDYVQQIREHFAVPITINSSCRCQEHNHAVGGRPNSQHKRGRAADIVVKGVEPQKVYDYAVKIGCAGIGNYNSFTHIDSRTKSGARW